MKLLEAITVETRKGTTFKSLISCLLGYTINPLVTEKRFNFKHEVDCEITTYFIESEKVVYINEVLSFAQKNKLERPYKEDIFLFAEQLPEEERYGKIIFLHEVIVWSGFMFYAALDYENEKQAITMISSDGYYAEGTRFVFRKE